MINGKKSVRESPSTTPPRSNTAKADTDTEPTASPTLASAPQLIEQPSQPDPPVATVQAELPVAVVKSEPETPDHFPVSSVWANEVLRMSLTVTQRDGEAFRGKFVIGDTIQREVKGTVKNGQVRWLAKHVRPVQGDVGGDHEGKFGEGDRSDELDFEWSSGAVFGNFTLRRR